MSVHDHVIAVAELIRHFLPLPAAPGCSTSGLNNVEDLSEKGFVFTALQCHHFPADACEFDRRCVFTPPPLFSVSQENLDESQISSSSFLRALMTVVFKSALKGEHSTSRSRDSSALLKSHR